MSAAEDDTELRDLLLQNLENSGVLNKLKAQMRAAVFLALEEQDRVQNKSPLVNENLKNCLNTKEGRLGASLVLDFLQVFHLDFTRAVFEPEIQLQKNLESREVLCKELGLGLNSKTPVILELLRQRYKDQAPDQAPDQAQTQVSEPGPKGDSILKREMDLDEVDDGDSFFDDPLPQPQKTYGCLVLETDDSSPGLVLRRDKSLSNLLVLAPRSDQDSEFRKPESPVQSLYLGHSSSSEPSRSGASKENGPKDSKSQLKKSGSQHIDEDVEYDDDFNSHRSDLSRSELSIGEEIEEVSIEGPEPSDKFDETTQDLSVSQLSHSHAVDYMEDVP